MPRYDLKTPCKHCPFRNDETRIVLMGRMRAAEIEDAAYRNGFPCHESAECVEDGYGEDEGFAFGPNTQHCAGYLILRIKVDGPGGTWPGIGNDEDRAERIAENVYLDAPVFESEEEFFAANEIADDRDN